MNVLELPKTSIVCQARLVLEFPICKNFPGYSQVHLAFLCLRPTMSSP